MLFTDEQLAKGTANRLDGLSEEEEENYRRKTNEFVLELCSKLDMNPRSKWYACTLTHRFFAYESFKRRDRLLVAATAVFLGGKMAENARRLLDVVGFYYSLRNKAPRPPEKSKLVQDLKEEVLAYERLMLHVIGFDLYIEIPRTKFGELGGMVKAHAPEAYTELVPWAADRLDDLYSKTTLCLRCDAAVIAQIAVYLAVRYFNLPEPKPEEGGGGGGGGGGGEKKPTTWRELFGLGDDAQTFCLIKRAIDVYRGNQFAGYDYRPLVRTMDLEIAAALANEKREDLVARGGIVTASPPPPPPPPRVPDTTTTRT